MNPTPLVPVPSIGPGYPRWSETLHDHSHVLIRPITRQDQDAERAFIEGLSAQSRRYSSLDQVRCPSERLIERPTGIDYVHDVALAAVTTEDSRERIVGIGRYSTDQNGLDCEFAVTVSDDWQEKGLGTLLMKHLIEVARARGIRRMTSIDSVENLEMKDLVKHLGFHSRVDPDEPSQVLHELVL